MSRIKVEDNVIYTEDGVALIWKCQPNPEKVIITFKDGYAFEKEEVQKIIESLQKMIQI